MADRPSNQYAIQFTGPEEFQVNHAKPIDPVGPTQLLLRVEACGICFSDTKLLKQFASHPRKSDVVSGLHADALATIPSYKPNEQTTVPGHEPVVRVVEVGDQVTNFKVGDRLLVQADWKHLPTATSNAAFGYNFEGALQEYVVLDERCVVAPNGEQYLVHVTEGPSAAAVGLIEPWATVEGSYAWPERNHPLAGGRVLVVAPEPEPAGLAELLAANTPAETTWVTGASLPEVAGRQFDDVIYFGANAAEIEAAAKLLATRATLCVVLGGQTIDRRVNLDVGRVHYDYIRFVGTTGSDPADGYAWAPATGDLREGDNIAIIGAAGPMGLMHVMRAVTSGVAGLKVTASDLSDDRLKHLAETIDPVAADAGIPVTYLNTNEAPLQPGFSHLTCLVPVPAVVSQTVDLAGKGAIVNAFAGIAAGTLVELDLQHMIENQVFILGTSGSEVSDMRTVLRKIEENIIDTSISLDAITGMAGFADAIESVINRTSGGKIMVYPMLHDLGLTRLVDMPEKLPHVAAQLNNGIWTKAAEEALLAGN